MTHEKLLELFGGKGWTVTHVNAANRHLYPCLLCNDTGVWEHRSAGETDYQTDPCPQCALDEREVGSE